MPLAAILASHRRWYLRRKIAYLECNNECSNSLGPDPSTDLVSPVGTTQEGDLYDTRIPHQFHNDTRLPGNGAGS